MQNVVPHKTVVVTAVVVDVEVVELVDMKGEVDAPLDAGV